MRQNLQVEIKFKRHMSKLNVFLWVSVKCNVKWFLLRRFVDLFLACSNTLLAETIPTGFC